VSRILILLVAAGCQGATAAPPAAETPETPEAAPEPPKPVYTSAVCCVTGRTCALDEAIPLATTCTCPGPDGDLQGHVC
jgi:hypothetical protein